MKTLLLFLAVCFCAKVMAQGTGSQISNLDYSVEFEFEDGKDINFYGEYFTPLKGTVYQSSMYLTVEKEFIFKDESFHIINPSTNEIELLYGNSPYLLVKLWKLSENQLFDYIDPFYAGSVSRGIEKRTNVYEYMRVDYNIERIFMWDKWFFVLPITKNKYKEFMGVSTDKRFLYIFIPEDECKIILSDSGSIRLFAPNEIYVLKEKSLITQKDILF